MLLLLYPHRLGIIEFSPECVYHLRLLLYLLLQGQSLQVSWLSLRGVSENSIVLFLRLLLAVGACHRLQPLLELLVFNLQIYNGSFLLSVYLFLQLILPLKLQHFIRELLLGSLCINQLRAHLLNLLIKLFKFGFPSQPIELVALLYQRS